MVWQLRKVIDNKKEKYIMQDNQRLYLTMKLIERHIEKLLIQKRNTQENMVMTAMPTIG